MRRCTSGSIPVRFLRTLMITALLFLFCCFFNERTVQAANATPWIPMLLLGDDAAGESPIVISILIAGPSEVNQSSGAQYTCTAYYSDGSSANVSSRAQWSDDSSYASIDNSGYLTTTFVPSMQTVNITASYGGESGTYGVIIITGGQPPNPDS